MKRYGKPEEVVTARLRFYGAALRETGNRDRHKTACHLNNRAENAHLPFRRRERAMTRIRAMRSLQKFAAAHASVQNPFNHDRSLERRARFKDLRNEALAEWRQLLAA
jgi:putative transposase